jgi:hypothetical protein
MKAIPLSYSFSTKLEGIKHVILCTACVFTSAGGKREKWAIVCLRDYFEFYMANV